MGERDEPILTEPEVITCVFLTGVGIEPGTHVFRMVGWVNMPDFGGDYRERRIAMRCTIPVDAARKLLADLQKVLAREHH